MYKIKKLALLGSVAILLATLLVAARSGATPPAGVVGTPLARGHFSNPTRVAFKVRYSDGRRAVVWARDASDIATNGFTFEPGGSTGWHSHPGPVVVLVKTGALTYYRVSAHGRCVGTVYPAGTAYVERGHGHVHMAQNESGVTVETSVVYFGVPEGESPRMEEDVPTPCTP